MVNSCSPGERMQKGKRERCCYEIQLEPHKTNWMETGASVLLEMTALYFKLLQSIQLCECRTKSISQECSGGPSLSILQVSSSRGHFYQLLKQPAQRLPKDPGEPPTITDPESSADTTHVSEFCIFRQREFLYAYSSCSGKFYLLPWNIYSLSQEVFFILSKPKSGHLEGGDAQCKPHASVLQLHSLEAGALLLG